MATAIGQRPHRKSAAPLGRPNPRTPDHPRNPRHQDRNPLPCGCPAPPRHDDPPGHRTAGARLVPGTIHKGDIYPGRRGSIHEYFFCRAKQEGLCDTKYIPTYVIEESVVDEYARLKLEPTFEADIQNRLTKALDSEQEDIKATYAALRNQLSEIGRKESRIVDLAADGTLPTSKIREKLFELGQQKNRIEDSLANVEGKIAAGGKLLAAALDQITDTQRYDQAAPDKVRRILT